MYSREKRVLLREYLEQGWSKSDLADRFGISRWTVHHWITTGQLERDLDEQRVVYKTRPAVSRKIDAFTGIIDARLQEYPKLSAVRILEEIRAAGYTGGYTQVKEYVRRIRPAPVVEPVVRFETPPAHQAQVDFAHFRLPWGRRYALLVLLGYSRLLWLKFYTRQNMQTLMTGLEDAFRFFGGVPRELLFDQLKAVIVEDHRADGGPLIENIEFVRFAHHWGFRARACRPYRAKTKGKVERPIRYVRENFFYGREFLNDADLDAQLVRWLSSIANVRVHRTTGEPPMQRFRRDERALLTPLAERSYRSITTGRQSQSGQHGQFVPFVEVERRPLEVYSQIAGGRV